MTQTSEPRCACGEPAVEDFYLDSASGPVRTVSLCRFCRYVPNGAPSPALWAIAARGLGSLPVTSAPDVLR
ncbi:MULTISPECIES: hypothetical protein [Streptomyces]|uniref:Uncharacterized protein n=1 Tax=Streptomyces ramulosus TaxID=47762 RepID=A0ABW1FTR6_9ACTN